MWKICAASILFFSLKSFCVLTKAESLETLKTQGIRWRQTELLTREAELTHKMAKAALAPHLEIAGRELATKADLTNYGFADPGPLQIVSFGGVFAQGEVHLFNKKNFYQEEAARTNIELQKQTTLQYQNDLSFLMLATYVNCQRLGERVKVFEKNIDRDQQIVEMAQSKVAAGVGLETDLMRAKGIVGFDNLRKIDAKGDLDKCRKDLANTMGLPDLKDELEPLNYKALHLNTTDPFMKTGIDDRPDVRASLLTVQAAKSLKQSSKAETLPTVQLLGEIGYGGNSLTSKNGGNLLGGVGLQIKLPFLDGGYFDAKAEQGKLNLAKAELQATQVRVEAEGQIQAALSKLKTTKNAADLAEEQVQLAQEELKITQHRFKSGASSGPDLAASQNNLSNVLLNQIEVISANEIAKINYYRSTSDLSFYVAQDAGAQDSGKQ